jgi:hypothetical protein
MEERNKTSQPGKPRIVYVIGAGLSAGLEFPTIANLLPRLWLRLAQDDLSEDLSAIVRFHHPGFNPRLPETFPNIEQLLSEMQANAELFSSSRPAIGKFTSEKLERCRRYLLLELAIWFHELKSSALRTHPSWLSNLTEKIKLEEAAIVSFNWDLVLDELLFGKALNRSSYGLDRRRNGPILIKPHGSLNWYEHSTGRNLKDKKKFSLAGSGAREIFAFRPFRAPKTTRLDREYMPLIVPPVYAKQFEGPLFKHLWQTVVAVLSTASEVRFLGYSLPDADFHARFILRCGFYNQEHGELRADQGRAAPTGRAKVTIVDPAQEGPQRIRAAVGWDCQICEQTIETWMYNSD